MSTIPLAKALNKDKLDFPVFLSEKLDGVPVRIDINFDLDAVTVLSRQGKPVPSVWWQAQYLRKFIRETRTGIRGTLTFVAEVTHKDRLSFKDTSGYVRRQEQNNDLCLNFFDFDIVGLEANFAARAKTLERLIYGVQEHANRCIRDFSEHWYQVIPQHIVHRPEDFDDILEQCELIYGPCEGFVARSHSAAFKPGSRHWDYQKVITDPTVDLRIIGIEQAVSKDGEPLGMAGRLIADYKGEEIGVGPGKLTHDERRELWQGWTKTRLTKHWPNRLAKIKHKRDQSYTALRQPTFQCWRDDKDEVSYE